MSSDSDSDSGEQFFDAEGSSPIKINRSKSKTSRSSPKNSVAKDTVPSESNTDEQRNSLNRQNPWASEGRSVCHPVPSEWEKKEIERKALENEKRRRKLEEMRRRVQIDDDDDDDDAMVVGSQTGSQTSSLDGLFIPRSTMPKVGEDDVHSVISLGKLGRILSGNETASLNSDNVSIVSTCSSEPEITSARFHLPLTPLQEPDLVASTKPERPNELMPPPVPPRRKRKNKVPLTPQLSLTSIDGHYPEIPSPASTVDKLTKDFEHSLDIKSAVKGLYVVKPQDEDKDKAEGPPSGNDTDNNNTFVGIEIEDNAEDGEDNSSKQMNMLLKMRTDSGKKLSDLEILAQVMVRNLDTGEEIPLSLAEDRLPRCVNPLSLQIMRLTSEYVSNSSLPKDKESDEDTDDQKSNDPSSDHRDTMRTQTRRFKKLLNRTVNRIKSVADEVKHARHNEETMESSEDEHTPDSKQSIKFKSASSHKGPYEFDNLKFLQDLTGEHTGAVWTMKFSHCGRLLATAGQDHVLRVWVLKDSYDYFNNMRQKYNVDSKIDPSPSQENLASPQSDDDKQDADDVKAPFMSKPFFAYTGHTADLLDVSWSKNYFILSSSMDKTVRLWHISRAECLCCFQHIDFVTAIAFHPRDDRYFLSGSLDGKLRLWNIPDKKVALWNELDGQTKLITAANFCQNGKYAVVGSYDGRCIFYSTEQLKYYTQIHVRSTRGKNSKGRKISGIEPIPGEDKILVTSNDSRIRLYDLRDLSFSCKYKGYVNLSSQIRASFSHDGKFIASGSENQYVYIWKTHHDYSKFSSARRDRNYFWEGIKAHNAVVTSAVFATNPSLILKNLEKEKNAGEETELPSSSSALGYVLVTADFNGGIKVFATRPRTKSVR